MQTQDITVIPNKLPISAELMEDQEIVTDWLNELLGQDLDCEQLGEELQNGVVLCQLSNSLSSFARLAGATNPPPLGIKRYHKTSRPGSIQARDNVSSFCLWCVLYEVPPVLILSPDDVVMCRNTSSVVSLLLYLVRKSSVFTKSRKSSTSSTRSLYDRVNRRSFSRGKSYECFNDVLLSRSNSRTSVRSNGLFRTRSQSVDSEGSIGSTGSANKSPTFGSEPRPSFSSEPKETVDLIRELNLACRIISKNVVVANVEIPGYDKEDELCINKCLGKESQSCIRRKNRLFLKSHSTSLIETSSTHLANKRRSFKPAENTQDPANVSLEKLTLEDIEHLLFSTSDTIISKLQAVYKLVSHRAQVHRQGEEYSFRVHTSLPEKGLAFKALRSFLISSVSDNKTVNFGEVHEVWSRRYATLSP